jgi:3-oxoacyl-[acyl-carrier-protein] synthase II
MTVDRAREPIAVVGAGLKAPGGLTPDELWTSWCAARSFATVFEDERLPSGIGVLAACVDGFDPAALLSGVQARRLDRCHHLALAAADDALGSLSGPLPAPERCAVVCGVGFGASGSFESQLLGLADRGVHALSPLTVPTVMPSSTAAQLSLRFGFRGPSLTVSTACASGTTAIGEGVELLRRGAADLVLAGGVDALVTYGVICAFLRLDAMTRNISEPALASRPFDVDRDGFVLAEGAGFVVLQRAEDVAAPPIGRVLGYGACSDAHHLVAPPDSGEGAVRCMQLALDDAGIRTDEVRHVNAHGTSTRLNDLAEAQALACLFRDSSPPVTSLKGTTGHMVGGSGAVEAIMTLWSLRNRLVPPVAGLRTTDPAITIDVVRAEPRVVEDGYALSNSFGFGGANASLVLAPPS